jgi:hypothetical protein
MSRSESGLAGRFLFINKVEPVRAPNRRESILVRPAISAPPKIAAAFRQAATMSNGRGGGPWSSPRGLLKTETRGRLQRGDLLYLNCCRVPVEYAGA